MDKKVGSGVSASELRSHHETPADGLAAKINMAKTLRLLQILLDHSCDHNILKSLTDAPN